MLTLPNNQTTALAYPPAAAAKIAGIGRTRLYEAIRDGDLIARKFGSRTLILDADLRRWLENLPAAQTRAA